MPACWHSVVCVRVCVDSGCQLAGIQLPVCVCALDASLLAFSHVASCLFGFLMFATMCSMSLTVK